MNITVPDTLDSLAAWYAAGMLAMFTLGLTAGILYSRGKLRDAAVIAAIVVKYHPAAAAELGRPPRPTRLRVRIRAARMAVNRRRAAIRLALRVNAPTEATLTMPGAEPQPRARDRFARQPDEFPLLSCNPLVPLLTRAPAEPVTPRYREGMFVITLRRGTFNNAAFLPA